ncbi:MAG: SGNH/GDSL hydrolase family protein [Nitrospira sp.]|nr:SGNH/GDSL hydrolase family protein [Nitrospira sp.]
MNSQDRQTVSSRRRISRRVLVLGVLVTALVGATMLEVVSYFYLRMAEGYDGEHLMMHQFDDYKNIHPTPHYQDTRGVMHNAQGFRRDEDVPTQKPAGTYRIFLMGGSTAYGLGSLSPQGHQKYPMLKNSETIAHYLEGYLNDLLPSRRIEVINAAISSHSSHHHLIYLNQTILKYHPDMVVFIDGYNDYYPWERGYDQFRDYPYRQWSHLYLDEPSFTAWVGYTGFWLYRKSHFVYLAGKKLRPLWWAIQNLRPQPRREINVDEALRNLELNAESNFLRMVERDALILNHEGIVPVFTLQPDLLFEQHKVLTDFEQRLSTEVDQAQPINYRQFKNRARPFVTAKLQQVTAAQGAPFIDMTDIFGEIKEDAFTDDCHLTPPANERVARYIGHRIAPLITRSLDNGGGRSHG